MSRDVVSLRAAVDEIDTRIAKLIRERILTARDIVDIKRAQGLFVTDPIREDVIISRVTKEIAVADRESVEQIYDALFREAKQ